MNLITELRKRHHHWTWNPIPIHRSPLSRSSFPTSCTNPSISNPPTRAPQPIPPNHFNIRYISHSRSLPMISILLRFGEKLEAANYFSSLLSFRASPKNDHSCVSWRGLPACFSSLGLDPEHLFRCASVSSLFVLEVSISIAEGPNIVVPIG